MGLSNRGLITELFWAVPGRREPGRRPPSRRSPPSLAAGLRFLARGNSTFLSMRWVWAETRAHASGGASLNPPSGPCLGPPAPVLKATDAGG